jgi:hypothetical protein
MPEHLLAPAFLFYKTAQPLPNQAKDFKKHGGSMNLF